VEFPDWRNKANISKHLVLFGGGWENNDHKFVIYFVLTFVLTVIFKHFVLFELLNIVLSPKLGI
jgi:hypothetical protein